MIIARYLTREIVFTLLTVTMILSLIFLSQQTVRYLNFVAIGKIPTSVLLELISFEAPYILSFLLPLGLYLSILLAYGRLYSDHEMSILQMYGYGNRCILNVTLKIALVVAFVVFILMFWVNPFLSAKRQKVMASDRATLHLVQTLIPGRFQVSPDGSHVMYVEKLSRDHLHAENIFMAEERKNTDTSEMKLAPWMLIVANLGYQTKDLATQDQFFVTENGYRYEGRPGENDYKVIRFKKYAVRIPENPIRIAQAENETLSMSQLWQDYALPRRAAELQWRISLTLATLMLALMAVPMSAIKPRQGRFVSLIPAILFYAIYIQLLYISRHWIEHQQVSALVGMWWVHALMLLFTLCVIFPSARSIKR